MFVQADGNEVKLYGTIWSGDGQYIVSELAPILKNNADVTIHLHTPGGSVFDGNLIYNFIAQSKANIHIVIDGLAASMGSILMLAGKQVSIAENAFVMIHAPSGGVDGNAKDFVKASKLLKAMEDNFIQKYTSKTGKSNEEVSAWLDGDNWFSAQEALSAGLVDEVISPIIQNLNVQAHQHFNMVATLKEFTAFDVDAKIILGLDPTPSAEPQTPKSKIKMELNAKCLDILGVSKDTPVEEVNAKIEALHSKLTQAEAREKETKTTQIKALLDNAVQEGRIVATEREDYQALAEANLELATKTIAKLPTKKSINASLNAEGKSNQQEGREKWTFQDWSKNDTKGLLEMKANDPDAYKELAAKSNIKL